MDNLELSRELRKCYTSVTVKKVKAIKHFYVSDTHPGNNREVAKKIKEKFGVTIGPNQLLTCVNRMRELGYKIAKQPQAKSVKERVIMDVMIRVNASYEVIKKTYDNLISNERMTANSLAESLSTKQKSVSHDTIKRIQIFIVDAGIKPKPICTNKKSKGFKLSTVSLDDGLIRWNPAKLMPEPFKHLDGAW